MEPDMFQLDGEGVQPSPSPQPRSSAGCSTPAEEHQPNVEIALERRVVVLLEEDDDVCSVCLEEYTSEDPGAPTVCGHHFHLQCIMQWAQRSRECPLCFKSLQLQDEDMNSLLPFGEYVSPEQRAAEAASLETWELERLLIRLATANQREHRHHRSGRHHGSSSGRHRRQEAARPEVSAPQPIQGGSTAAAAAGSAQWALPGEASSSSSTAAAASSTPLRAASAPGGAYPSSWPPAHGAEEASSSSAAVGTPEDEGHMLSPRSRSGPMSLKSRLASLKLKDKFDKTAKELSKLFSPGSGSSTHR